MSSTEGSSHRAIFKDVELGDPATESWRNSTDAADYSDMNEYSALQKYITTYRDPRAMPSADEEEAAIQAEEAKKNKKWWKFGRGGSGTSGGRDTGVVPEEWLNTHINQGISSADVETRRRKYGWNELTTEKENMWLKFLSYFTGPILYGKLTIQCGVSCTNAC
jgi:H+-transporting ATPase